jgi:hypothetical protein
VDRVGLVELGDRSAAAPDRGRPTEDRLRAVTIGSVRQTEEAAARGSVNRFGVRVGGQQLTSAAFAASVLVVLSAYAASLPFANGQESPLRWNGIILWIFASLSAVGAASLLRRWRPGMYLAGGVAMFCVILATLGLLYIAGWILLPGRPVRGFSTEFVWLDIVLPTLVLVVLTSVTAWRITKLLSAGARS